MKISRADYERIMRPELRDPETEARRRALIESSKRLGTLICETLASGVAVQPEKLKLPRDDAARPSRAASDGGEAQ